MCTAPEMGGSGGGHRGPSPTRSPEAQLLPQQLRAQGLGPCGLSLPWARVQTSVGIGRGWKPCYPCLDLPPNPTQGPEGWRNPRGGKGPAAGSVPRGTHPEGHFCPRSEWAVQPHGLSSDATWHRHLSGQRPGPQRRDQHLRPDSGAVGWGPCPPHTHSLPPRAPRMRWGTASGWAGGCLCLGPQKARAGSQRVAACVPGSDSLTPAWGVGSQFDGWGLTHLVSPWAPHTWGPPGTSFPRAALHRAKWREVRLQTLWGAVVKTRTQDQPLSPQDTPGQCIPPPHAPCFPRCESHQLRWKLWEVLAEMIGVGHTSHAGHQVRPRTQSASTSQLTLSPGGPSGPAFPCFRGTNTSMS